jgi:hypothetical protein
MYFNYDFLSSILSSWSITSTVRNWSTGWPLYSYTRIISGSETRLLRNTRNGFPFPIAKSDSNISGINARDCGMKVVCLHLWCKRPRFNVGFSHLSDHQNGKGLGLPIADIINITTVFYLLSKLLQTLWDHPHWKGDILNCFKKGSGLWRRCWTTQNIW